MYLLYESSSGYGLFEAHGLDEIGQNTEAVRSSVSDLSRFGRVVQLTAFHPSKSALDALNQINAVSEGNPPLKLDLFPFFLFYYNTLFLFGLELELLCNCSDMSCLLSKQSLQLFRYN